MFIHFLVLRIKKRIVHLPKNSDLPNWMGCFTPRPCWSPDSRSDNLQVEPLQMKRTHRPTERVHTVDGQNPAPRMMITVSHYLQGFNPPRCRISSINCINNCESRFEAIDSKVPDGIYKLLPRALYYIYGRIYKYGCPPSQFKEITHPFDLHTGSSCLLILS